MPTIQENFQQLDTLRSQLAANLTDKGVETASTEGFATLVPKVANVETGIELPVTTTATEADIRNGKTAYNNLGNLLTGKLFIPTYGCIKQGAFNLTFGNSRNFFLKTNTLAVGVMWNVGSSSIQNSLYSFFLKPGAAISDEVGSLYRRITLSLSADGRVLTVETNDPGNNGGTIYLEYWDIYIPA